ncbi:MAG: hypothetical protein HOY69_33095 [Streptomyces sp.]|nr:hypothetical protein [Streptomyces sp.]
MAFSTRRPSATTRSPRPVFPAGSPLAPIFALVDSPEPEYLFIAGGIGVTPIMPMIEEIAAPGARWSLLYGGRSRSSRAFLPELARYGDRVTVRPQDEYGLLDLDAFLGRPRRNASVCACGPEPLLSAVEQRCAD